jgi:uncharacterized protein
MTETNSAPYAVKKWHFVLPAAIAFILFYPVILAPGLIAAYLIVMWSSEPLRPYFFAAVNIILAIATVWGVWALAVGSSKGLGKGRSWWVWTLDVVRTFTFKILYNLGKLLKLVLGISREDYEAGFVAFNNSVLATRRFTLAKPGDILLLLPQCLQDEECDVRLQRNVTDCKGCGTCDITDILALAKEHHIPVDLATGGEAARQKIADSNASAVLAVACERELASGILDSFPRAVWGVLNIRNDGYCKTTEVDCDRVRSSLLFMLGRGPVPKPTL